MSITSPSKCCPKCGGPIPAEAPQGLCPGCLFQQASAPTEAGKGESAKSAPPTHEELAAAFPQLEILGLIGQGGMGFVFKARQPKLERFVALKILPATLAADPAFAERFAREARMLARLSHPNIVAIYDFGQAGGFYYLLMELVDGVNLREAMRVGRFTPAQALSVVPKICEALEFAHNEGILHRDIKPENILLDTKGRVKVADFGIAKLLAEPETDPSLTASGAVLGTPNYMAPEQLEKSGAVDQRADIYSLGVVFYEMLTGELPLGRFQPPSQKVQVDVRLDEVVLHALEKEPARRYQQVGQVKTAVETISGSAAGPAPVGTPPLVAVGVAPVQRPDRFWRWFAVVVLALIVIPVGIVVVAMLIPALARHRAQQQRAMAAQQTNTVSRLAQKANAQPGKTLVLQDAKNDGQRVSLTTMSALLPGETLVALTRLPNGQTEEKEAHLSINHAPTNSWTASEMWWSFPDSFSPHEVESAVPQLRRNVVERPVVLAPGEPLALFSVTNQFGDALRGYLEFRRFVPKPPGDGAGPEARVHGSVSLKPGQSTFYLCFFSATVPPGYRMEATASPSNREYTSYGRGFCSWNPPETFPSWRSRDASRHLEDLAKQGPIDVYLGEPRQMFSLTNEAGEVYRAFFELVGPPAAVGPPDHLAPAGGSSATVPSLAPPAVEGKFIMDTWRSGRAESKPGELVWRFKCFVPPSSLASILFVRWTNGVPQVDPGFSAYFKVGKGGGVDIPFCSLLCHRLVKSEAWGEMSADQRFQALVRMGYPESAGVTNAFYWSVDLGSGWVEGCWTNMPPYHGLKLQLPQSVRSGHQRAIRLIDFDTPEGKGSQGQSGVELRIFLEPLKSPPIRMVPNEKDHTNYISGTGLAGTMEDALRAIKEWPTDP